jgi:putative tryptophan/tyrosine transport system substrate-binding protein
MGVKLEARGNSKRNVIGLVLSLSLLANWHSALGQPAKMARVGALFTGPSATASPYVEAFRQGLRELRYVEGRDIHVEYRWAELRTEHFAELAGDLVRAKVDILFTWGSTATAAAKHATSTIPIVFVGIGDPVGSGFVGSLSRPGGTITGQSNLSRELGQKHLELLKEIVPGLARMAAFRNPDNPVSELQLRDVDDAARSFTVQLQVLQISDPAKFDGAFLAMRRERAEALIVLADPVFLSNRRQIAELAAKSRLPTIFNVSQYTDAGGLIAYGPSLIDMFRRATIYIDKILKGTKPGDLPVEQPSKFELVINLKTAKQIGLTIPPNVLARADRVIK